MKHPRYYSGPKSKAFWKKINSFKGKNRDTFYSFGCMLQTLENIILLEIERQNKKK